MLELFKFALENNEITISKEEFMAIACQEATEELTKVYKRPNKKYEKAMAQFSFILARIVFEIFDKPQIQKARTEQTAPEEPTAEPTEEVQEETTEQATQVEPVKEKRYFKVLRTCYTDTDGIETSDIGELVGITEDGHYGLANEKWKGHSCGGYDVQVEEKYQDHCWWFKPDRIEEVKTEE